MPDIAVLTGDIVRSTALAPAELDAAMAAIAAATAAASGWAGGPVAFSRFRGDGWQCLLPAPSLALRLSLCVKAALRMHARRLDTRISIGIGEGVVPENGDLAAGRGPAFRASGHGLDSIARRARMAIEWASPPPGAGKVRAIVALCDEIARRWTPAQANVLAHALVPGGATQAEIADAIEVSQQTVAKHLAAAGDWALEHAMAALEAEG